MLPALGPCVPAGQEGSSHLIARTAQPGVRQTTDLEQPLGTPLEQLPCSRHEAVHVITLFVQPR